MLTTGGRQSLPEQSIGGHTAADAQRRKPRLLESQNRLFHQRIDNSCLKAGRQIGDLLCGQLDGREIRFAWTGNGIADRGLQPAKAKIQRIRVVQPTWKLISTLVATF